MTWTAPRTAVAGEGLTADIWNTYVRDLFLAGFPAGVTGWTAYTATWTGSGSNPTYTQTVGAYCQVGKWVHAEFVHSYTSGGTGTWRFALPVAARYGSGSRVIGHGIIADAAPAHWTCAFVNADTTYATAYVTNSGASGLVTQTAPITWASGDAVFGVLDYEVA